MDCDKKPYKPGFFCALFWVFTWLGMLGGIVCLQGSIFIGTTSNVSIFRTFLIYLKEPSSAW